MEKQIFFFFDQSDNSDAVDVKVDGSFPGEKFYSGIFFLFLIRLGLLYCLYCQNSPLENWSLDLYDFFSLKVALYLYKFCYTALLGILLSCLGWCS